MDQFFPYQENKKNKDVEDLVFYLFPMSRSSAEDEIVSPLRQKSMSAHMPARSTEKFVAVEPRKSQRI